MQKPTRYENKRQNDWNKSYKKIDVLSLNILIQWTDYTIINEERYNTSASA